MKAIVKELWNTGREIVEIEGVDGTPTLKALDRCENVLLEYPARECGGHYASIDNAYCFIRRAKIQHPATKDSVSVIEIF